MNLLPLKKLNMNILSIVFPKAISILKHQEKQYIFLLKSVLILLQIKKNEIDFIDIGKEIKEKD